MAMTVFDHCKGVQKTVSNFTNNICQIIREFRGHDDPKENMRTINSVSPGNVPNSVSDFTNDLCKIFAESTEENYICSSFSAHVALSMAAYGADNNTAIEMRRVLHIPDNNSEFLGNYNKITDILINKENIVPDDPDPVSRPMFECEYDAEKKKQPSIAILANKIYISKDIEVRDQYESLLETYFRSKSESLDFSDPDKSVDIVNKWCSVVTNKKINSILSPVDISSCSTLILLNAVYFKAYWLHEFVTTELKTFYLSMCNKIKVPTMYLEKELYYKNLKDLNAQAVRLDFMGGNQYMEIIVPNKIDGLKTLLQHLDKVNEKEFKYADIRLWLPKFEIETKINFNNHLKELGIVEAFDETTADFNKICNKKIFIHKVLQKAYIKVDELGCEAAAVTAVLLTDMSDSITIREPTYITIKADRPFLFIIKDVRIGIPLFIGSVVNPQESVNKLGHC